MGGGDGRGIYWVFGLLPYVFIRMNMCRTHMKNPLFGSKAVLMSSDKNSRNTPPPSMPTSSNPTLFIIWTRIRGRKSGSKRQLKKKLYISSFSTKSKKYKKTTWNKSLPTIFYTKFVECIFIQMWSSNNQLNGRPLQKVLLVALCPVYKKKTRKL